MMMMTRARRARATTAALSGLSVGRAHGCGVVGRLAASVWADGVRWGYVRARRGEDVRVLAVCWLCAGCRLPAAAEREGAAVGARPLEARVAHFI